MAQPPVKGADQNPKSARRLGRGASGKRRSFCIYILHDMQSSKKHIFTLLNCHTMSRMILALLIIVVAAASCTASRKGNCGCPSKRDLIGY